MDTFNFLWPTSAPSAANLNTQFHQHNMDVPSSLPNSMPPPHHFFIPQAVNKLIDCQTFGDPQPTASIANMPCDMQDLLQRLNAFSSVSALATQTRMFEAKHTNDVMAAEQTVLPSCSSTNLFQSSVLSASTSSSESLHEPESRTDRTVLPQSAGFPAVPTHLDESQQFSTNSSPNSTSLASTFPTVFPIMSTADNFLHAALNTLVVGNENDSDAGSSGDSSLPGGGRNVLLCQICSDTASGLHYGVTSCEGFFRRSIQQAISYRPCTKNQQCAIVRNNRNRCQACRLKKCLSVGMSRDAVRFGRVPKREKARIVEEMQRASIRSQIDSMKVELEDDQLLTTSIHAAFVELGNALQREVINAPGSSFMPGDENESILNSSQYLPAILSVVNFAKSVRGFPLLFQSDRIQLLKSSFFQIMLLRLCALKVNNRTELLDLTTIPQLLFLSNSSSSMEKAESMSLLRSSIIEFVQRFRLLNLNEQQQSLVCALVLCQSESTATQFQEASLAKMLQEKLWWLLQSSIFPNQQAIHSITGPMLIQSLFAIFGDLKTLNSVYQEQMQSLRCYTISAPTIPVEPIVLETKTASEPLKRPIAKRPKPTKPNVDKLRENNKLLAELLEQPSQIAAQLQAKNTQPKVVQAPAEDEDNDQPLNLCVRDAQRL